MRRCGARLWRAKALSGDGGGRFAARKRVKQRVSEHVPVHSERIML
jgi:hypothetical protein